MADRMCAACGEVKRLVGRGLCNACWKRAKDAGTLDQFGRSRRTFAESYELAQANETDSGCWPWPTVNRTGYATNVMIGDGRAIAAYAAAWRLVNGPIPDGMTIDHRCHTDDPTCPGGDFDPHRRCVRPDHLQLASHQQQQQWQHKYRAPHCRNGHPRTEANVRVLTKTAENGMSYPVRTCRACARETTARARQAGPAA